MTQPLENYAVPREDWMSDALCAQTDPELFYPDKSDCASPRVAKRVCQSCPVAGECLEYALAHDERFGVWGGLTARERRPLARKKA